MAYSLQLHHETVLPYLRDHEGLSREARVRLFTTLDSVLRTNADSFMQNPDRRLGPGSDCFWIDIVLMDPDTGLIRKFWFVVNDAAAPYGVLQVVYVEEGSPPVTL